MDPVDLAYAGIARQAELIAGGEVSSRELGHAGGIELRLTGHSRRLDA